MSQFSVLDSSWWSIVWKCSLEQPGVSRLYIQFSLYCTILCVMWFTYQCVPQCVAVNTKHSAVLYSALSIVCYVTHLSVCVTVKHKTQCSSIVCYVTVRRGGHFTDNSQTGACGEKFRVGYISRMLILSFQLIDKHTRGLCQLHWWKLKMWRFGFMETVCRDSQIICCNL